MSFNATQERRSLTQVCDDGLTKTWSMQLLREIESQGSWSEAAWQFLTTTGVLGLGLTDAEGATPSDAAAVGRSVGRHAALVPWVELGFVLGILSVARNESSVAEEIVQDITRGSLVVPIFPEYNEVAPFGHIARAALFVTAETVSYLPQEQFLQRRQHVMGPMPYGVIEPQGQPIVLVQGAAARSAIEVGNRWRAFNRISYATGALESLCAMVNQYAGEREQFGRPIAQFQAVQHHLADIVIDRERCIALCEHLGFAFSGLDATELAQAQVFVTTAYHEAARLGCQVHGGYGFTMEYDPQVHFRLSKTMQIEACHPGSSWL